MTLVLLCRDLARLGGLTPDELGAELLRREPDVRLAWAPGPCRDFARWLGWHADGAERVILGLCTPPEPATRDVHLRRRGLDPATVDVVALGGDATPVGGGAARAARRLAAAVARVRACRGSRPEGLKPVLARHGELSRRALLTLPAVSYEAIPVVDATRCAAADGCRICTATCPHGALAPGPEGAMAIEAARCTGCGACVGACPRLALELPRAAPAEIDAQLDALLDGGEAPGIAFVCERAAEHDAGPTGWFPISVPCAGAVAPGWLVQALARGAAAVAVRPCGRDDCRFGRPGLVADRVAYCRALLDALGDPADRAQLLAADGPVPPPPAVRPLVATPATRGAPLGDPAATAEAVLALAHGRPDAVVAHPQSPLGLVDLAPGCTACGACVRVCPTGALALERDGEGVALTFEAARCVGCAACAPACPERVVEVARATAVVPLAAGRRALHRSAEARCVTCGGPIAPQAMLDRLRALLGDDPVAAVIARHCSACRGASAGPPGP
jgi:ferredoxin